MTDHEAENKKLRERLAVVTNEAANNETILRRSQERELDLLKAESLPDLFARTVFGLAESCGLDAVTLVLCDPQHEVRHLLMSDRLHPDETPGVLFVDSLVGMAPQFASFNRPWLGPYMGSDHQLVFPGAEKLNSVAMMPLIRQDKLIGSLNFGSVDDRRFTRHHATDFLNHLAIITVFCLENSVNRARLVRSGLTDVLTGWHNRRYLQTRLREELARAKRDQKPLVCLMMDVDHFKRVNDTYGHLAGDTVLREIVQRVECEIRASDVAARYGGEEFVVLLPATSMQDAVPLADRIRNAVAGSPIDINDETSVAITVSIGIADTIPKPNSNDLKTAAEALIAAADLAMYQAKSDGRDRICING